VHGEITNDNFLCVCAGWYKKLTAFKKRFPHLKVTLAIGGWNEGSPKYSKMASDPASRAQFIASVLEVIE